MFARDRRLGDDDAPECPVCADDHGDDPRRPTGTAALAVGRAGVGAVGVGPAQRLPITWIDHLLRPAGRPERTPGCEQLPYCFGRERGDDRGGAGHRRSDPRGLAAAGPGPVGGGRRPSPTATSPTARWPARELAGSPPVAVYADNATFVGRCASPSCCCSRRPGRCPRLAGGGRRGSWRSRRRHCCGSRVLLPRPFYPPFQSVSSPLAMHVLVGPLTVVWVTCGTPPIPGWSWQSPRWWSALAAPAGPSATASVVALGAGCRFRRW